MAGGGVVTLATPSARRVSDGVETAPAADILPPGCDWPRASIWRPAGRGLTPVLAESQDARRDGGTRNGPALTDLDPGRTTLAT